MRQTGNKMSRRTRSSSTRTLPTRSRTSRSRSRYRSARRDTGLTSMNSEDSFRTTGASGTASCSILVSATTTTRRLAYGQPPTCRRRSSTLLRLPICENSISVRPSIPQHPYEPDSFNVGPRLGFAWTVDDSNSTVVRGGVGYLFSPHLPATVRQSVADPYVGFRVIWNRTESVAPGSRLARLQRRLPRCRPGRRRRKKDHLLRVRPGDFCALHHSVDGECPAAA